MKTRYLLPALSLLAACGPGDDDTIHYECGDHRIEARYMEETVIATIDNRAIQMQHARAASGIRFEAITDPSIVFWAKGSDATLYLGTQSIECEED